MNIEAAQPLLVDDDPLAIQIMRRILSVGEHWRRVSDARVAEIVSAASDAIVSCGDDGHVLLANAAASCLFDAPQSSLVGRNIGDLIGVGLDEHHDWSAQSAQIRVLQRSGANFPAELSVSKSGVKGDHFAIESKHRSA